jgi:GntP family gluconate:H+ symporter
MVFVNLPLWLKSVLLWVGNPVMALLIGLLLSMLVVPKGQFAALRSWMKEAVEHAGTILVIVGAGGVFGEVLKHTSLADLVTSFSDAGGSSKLMFLLVAWTMGVLLKTAQGSTTSAMIVVTSIIAPLTAAAGFTSPLQLSLLLAAVAGGTMMVSHTNDAYFWVIAQFGGLDMNQTYKTFSLATVAMSVAVLILVVLLALALGLGNG